MISLQETEDVKEYFPENVNSHLDINGATDLGAEIRVRADECMFHTPHIRKVNHRFEWYNTEW